MHSTVMALALRPANLAQAVPPNAERFAARSRLRGHDGGTPQRGGRIPGGHRLP